MADLPHKVLHDAMRGDICGMQIVVEILVDNIKCWDASHEAPCLLVVQSAYNVLFHESDVRCIQGLRKWCPDFLRESARFLMSPRSPEEMDELLHVRYNPHNPGSGCRCAANGSFEHNPFVRELHFTSKLFDTSVVEGPFLEYFFSFLCIHLNIVIDCTFANLSARQLARERRRRHSFRDERLAVPWPSSFEDLFPFGAIESAKALCTWIQYFPADPQGLNLLVQLWNHAVDAAHAKSYVQIVLAKGILPVVERLLSDFEATPSPRSSSTEHAFLDDMYKVVLPALSPLVHMDILRFWGSVEHDEWSANLLPLANICVRIHKALCEIPANLRMAAVKRAVPHDPAWRGEEWFLSYALSLHHDRHIPLERPLYTTMVAAAQVYGIPNEPEPPIHDPVHILSGYVYFIENDEFCANPGCMRTSFASSHKLYLCSGCARIRYCSRGCQRAAWRHERAPHRQICAAVRAMMDGIDAHFETCDKEPQDRQERFVHGCRLSNANPTAVAQILDHLQFIYTV